MNKKKKVSLTVCIIIIALSIICGIICAYECRICKFYADLEKFFDLGKEVGEIETGESHNFEGFLLMLFASIFSFTITICGCLILFYILKNELIVTRW